MSDARKQIVEQLDSLSKQAQNYRYAGAYQRLDELKQFMESRKKETQPVTK